jgi:hypothetical protein
VQIGALWKKSFLKNKYLKNRFFCVPSFSCRLVRFEVTVPDAKWHSCRLGYQGTTADATGGQAGIKQLSLIGFRVIKIRALFGPPDLLHRDASYCRIRVGSGLPERAAATAQIAQVKGIRMPQTRAMLAFMRLSFYTRCLY